MNTPFGVCDTTIEETVKLTLHMLLIVIVIHHVKILFVSIPGNVHEIRKGQRLVLSSEVFGRLEMQQSGNKREQKKRRYKKSYSF
jgi:hypothetical protein